MAEPQAGIFATDATHHYFLEFSVSPQVPREELYAGHRATGKALGSAVGVNMVLGFSGPLWETLTSAPAPALLRPFLSLQGHHGKSVPGTQNDLWLWLSGTEKDRLFDAAMEVHRALARVGALRLEQPAFHYLDSRDLTGFVDGTVNPKGDDARAAALIPEGQPHAGGSYLIAMEWIHDLAAFHALPEPEQEKVIGRRKADSEELPAAQKPETAHIARAELERDGEELPIYRCSVPFGTVQRHGLYFLAFSNEPERFNQMLARMYGLTEDGLEDRLTDFSRPVTAANYFAPSAEDLAQVLGG